MRKGKKVKVKFCFVIFWFFIKLKNKKCLVISRDIYVNSLVTFLECDANVTNEPKIIILYYFDKIGRASCRERV